MNKTKRKCFTNIFKVKVKFKVINTFASSMLHFFKVVNNFKTNEYAQNITSKQKMSTSTSKQNLNYHFYGMKCFALLLSFLSRKNEVKLKMMTLSLKDEHCLCRQDNVCLIIVIVVLAFLSWTLWGSPSMCTHTCTCTNTGTLHRMRGLRVWPFSITLPCRQLHSVFGGFYLCFRRMRLAMSGAYHSWR